MLDLQKNLIYKEVIKDHYKNPLNLKIIEGLKVYRSKNPFCGDEVNLQIEFDENNVIKNIYHKSVGCSISVSSVSVLTSVLKGLTLKEGIYMVENFIKMTKGEEFDKNLNFKDGIVFENIKDYPARQTCATVGWILVLKALNNQLKGIK